MWKKYSNLGCFLVFGLNKFSFDRKAKSLAEKKLYKRSNIISLFNNIFQIFVIKSQKVKCFRPNEPYFANFERKMLILALW